MSSTFFTVADIAMNWAPSTRYLIFEITISNVLPLELPFRVVDIATGDLGNVASRKFDVEAWYPAQAQFREVVSASNVLAHS